VNFELLGKEESLMRQYVVNMESTRASVFVLQLETLRLKSLVCRCAVLV